jgi:hypothetical protein
MKYVLMLCLSFIVACGQTSDFQSAPPSAYDCSVAQTSTGATISCPNGTTANLVNGVNGTNGSNGINGTNGINGANGLPGTKITLVQFCSGTPSYPSTFPEVGFCIEGSIYAVYSANDGFLTYLPPGAYSSNAVGSSCNFTVSAECAITQ